MNAYNIETTVNLVGNFSASDSVSSSANTGDVINLVCIICFVVSLLFFTLFVIQKLKHDKFTYNNNKAIKISTLRYCCSLVLAIIFLCLGGWFIISDNTIKAEAKDGILAPNAINAYVNDNGEVSFDTLNLSSENGLNLKFDGIKIDLCDDVKGLENSVLTCHLDDELIYNSKLPGENIMPIKLGKSSTLKMDITALDSEVAYNLAGHSIFKMSFMLKELNFYEVVFDPNNGEKPWKEMVEEESCVDRPQVALEYAYHDFVEWQLDGEKYDFNAKIMTDITLKVLWLECVKCQTPNWKENALVYDDRPHVPNNLAYWENYNWDHLQISDYSEQTDAGEYDCCFAPRYGFCWDDDGTKELRQRAWKIEKMNVKFTGKSYKKMFDGEDYHTDEVNAEGLLSSHVSDVKYQLQGLNAGEYTGEITAAEEINIYRGGGLLQDVTKNYSIVSEPGKLIITKSTESWTVNLERYESVYNGLPQFNVNNVTTTAIGEVNYKYYWKDKESESVESLSDLTWTDVCNNEIIVDASTNNYEVGEVKVSSYLTITQKYLKFYSDTKTMTFTDTVLSGGDMRINNEGLVSGHTHNVIYEPAKGKEPGSYEGKFSYDEPDTTNPFIKDSDGNNVTSNYSIETVPGTLTITKYSLPWHVSMSDVNLTFNGEYQIIPNNATNDLSFSEEIKNDAIYYISSDQETWWKFDDAEAKFNENLYLATVEGPKVFYLKATNETYCSKESQISTFKVEIEKKDVEFRGKLTCSEETGSVQNVQYGSTDPKMSSNGLCEGHTHNCMISVTYDPNDQQWRDKGYPRRVSDTVKYNGESLLIKDTYGVDVTFCYKVDTPQKEVLRIIESNHYDIWLDDYECTFADGADLYNTNVIQTNAKDPKKNVYEYSWNDDFSDSKSNLSDLKQQYPGEYTIYVRSTNDDYDSSTKTARCSAKLKIKQGALKPTSKDLEKQHVLTYKCSPWSTDLKPLEIQKRAVNLDFQHSYSDMQLDINWEFDKTYIDLSIDKNNFNKLNINTKTDGGKQDAPYGELDIPFSVQDTNKYYEPCNINVKIKIEPFTYIFEDKNNPDKGVFINTWHSQNVNVKVSQTILDENLVPRNIVGVGQIFKNDSSDVVLDSVFGENHTLDLTDSLVKYIGYWAFNNTPIQEVLFNPNNCQINNIGNNAFFTPKLKQFGNSPDTFQCPPMLAEIYENAFALTKFKTLLFNNTPSLTRICSNAFFACENVESMSFDNSAIKFIEKDAFAFCDKFFKDEDGRDKEGLIYGDDAKSVLLRVNEQEYIKHLEIPSTVRVIAAQACQSRSDYNKWRKVIINNDSCYINEYAFANNPNLETFLVKSNTSQIHWGNSGTGSGESTVLSGCSSYCKSIHKELIIAGNQGNLPAFPSTALMPLCYGEYDVVIYNDYWNYSATTFPNFKPDNYYYLTSDVYQTGVIPQGGNYCVLDLNGHTIQSPDRTSRHGNDRYWWMTQDHDSFDFWILDTSEKVSGRLFNFYNRGGDGGAINTNRHRIHLHLYSVKFEDCWTKSDGGAINLDGGETDSSLLYCYDEVQFINCLAGPPENFTSSKDENNWSHNNKGGAIMTEYRDYVYINGAYFYMCASARGGAICTSNDAGQYDPGCDLYLENCVFERCYAPSGASGGVLHHNNRSSWNATTIKKCLFINNGSSDCGGVIFSKYGGKINIYDSEFYGNYDKYEGPGRNENSAALCVNSNVDTGSIKLYNCKGQTTVKRR